MLKLVARTRAYVSKISDKGWLGLFKAMLGGFLEFEFYLNSIALIHGTNKHLFHIFHVAI